MSYASGTTHYNLPQTVGTDKRDWTDTNQAFATLDSAVYSASTTASSAASAAASAASAASAADTKATNAASAASTANTKATNAASAASAADTKATNALNAIAASKEVITSSVGLNVRAIRSGDVITLAFSGNTRTSLSTPTEVCTLPTKYATVAWQEYPLQTASGKLGYLTYDTTNRKLSICIPDVASGEWVAARATSVIIDSWS